MSEGGCCVLYSFTVLMHAVFVAGCTALLPILNLPRYVQFLDCSPFALFTARYLVCTAAPGIIVFFLSVPGVIVFTLYGVLLYYCNTTTHV